MSPPDRSVLADALFERVTFKAPGTGGAWGTDEFGQPVWIPGAPVDLVALFAPWKRTQLEHQPGADSVEIEGRGDLVDPLAFPGNVTVGTELTVTYAGAHWVARLTNITPNDLTGVAFGAYFECVLRPEVGS